MREFEKKERRFQVSRRNKNRRISDEELRLIEEALEAKEMADQRPTSTEKWRLKDVAAAVATFDMIGRVVAYGGVVLGILMLIQLIVGLDQEVLYAAQKLLIALVAFMILYKGVYDQFVSDEEE